MINYYFDNHKTLKPFTIALEANDNSLTPTNALRIEPIFKDGFWPCEKDGKWIQVEDHRGKVVYSKETQKPLLVSEIGCLQDDYTESKPNTVFDKWVDGIWAEDLKQKAEHKYITNKSIINELTKNANEKIAILQDAIDLDMAEEGDADKLKKWRKYRVLLSRVDTSVEDMKLPKKPD